MTRMVRGGLAAMATVTHPSGFAVHPGQNPDAEQRHHDQSKRRSGSCDSRVCYCGMACSRIFKTSRVRSMNRVEH